MRRRADIPVAAAAGAATAFAFPNSGWWPLALIGPAILFGILRGQRRGRSAVIAGIWGVTFFASLIGWIGEVDLLGWGALTLLQAAWVALFGFVIGSTSWGGRDTPRFRATIVVAMCWVAIEILRARYPLGGFQWGVLGYPFVDVPGVRDLAAIGGVHLVSGWVALVAAVFVRQGEPSAVTSGDARKRLVGFAAIIGAAVLAAFVPYPSTTGSIEVALVQGNVPKERFATAAGRRGRVGPEDIVVVENHLVETEKLLADPDRPDLVVWPENAFDRDPDAFTELAGRTQALIDQLGVPFIVGAIVDDPDGRSFNAALLWLPGSGIVDRYEKRHLVPFGEYVPWGWPREVIPALREQVPSDLSVGTSDSVLTVDGVAIGNVICFESSDPRDVRRAALDGAQVILISTNDATFGDSAAAAQHLQAGRMRAIEHRRTVLQAAISGISAVIGPDGTTSQRSGLFEATTLRASVPVVTGDTVYGIIGGGLERGMIAFGVLAIVAALMPGRHRRDELIGSRPRLGRILVAIPTYNEADTIGATVGGVRAHLPVAEIWVLDDASPDGTGAIMEHRAATDPSIRVIHRPGKGGLGRAYLDAFRDALADPNIDAVIEMDADGSHAAEDLPALVAAAADADVVIGSRYVTGGRIVGWSRARELLSRAGSVYGRLWLGLPQRDLTSGFRLYRRSVLERLPLDRVGSEGYAFQIETTLRAARLGARIVEVPIVFRERTAGASKMSKRIVFEALWRVPFLAFRRGR